MKIYTVLISLFFVFLSNVVSYSQVNDDYYDLFKKKVNKNKLRNTSGTQKEAWNKCDSAYTFLLKRDFIKFYTYINKSDSLNSSDSILKYWNKGLRGIVEYRKNDIRKSLKLLNESITFFLRHKNSFMSDYSLAIFFQFKGRALSDIGLVSNAINSYIKSDKYLKTLNFEQKIYENYKFIGRAYKKSGIFGNEKFVSENYFLALKGFKKIKKADEIAWMYLILSDFYIEQKEPEMALRFQDSCYMLAKALGNKELIPISLNNYGEIYLYKNNLKKAEAYFKKAVPVYKKNKNIKNLQVTYHNLAHLYFKKNNIKKSLEYTDSAVFLAEKGENDLNLINFYLLKKDILISAKQDVSELFNNYIELNNKLNKENQQNILFAYQEFFKTETLRKENEYLTEKNVKKDEQIYSLIIILILLGIILIGFAALAYLLKKRREYLMNAKIQDLQLQTIQSQIFPHLLFNTVSAAGSVIYKEKRETAYDYLVKMSQLMRKALIDTKRLYKSLQDEIDFVENYLQIQKIRFKERFDYIINTESNIDLNIQVPQMIIQTYVENAVKYGMEPLKKGGLLEVYITKKQNIISFIIKDNGIGIEESEKILNKKGTGSGFRIMDEIYKIHNKKNTSKISYKIEDLYKKEGKGTKVTVEIKL